MAAIKSDEIRQAVYNKYLLPIKNKSSKHVGIELEYPMINLQSGPVDRTVIQGLIKELIGQFGFEPVAYDNDGDIYSIEDRLTGDNISFDYSYNTLEFSLGKTIDLFAAENHFTDYYTAVQRYFSDYHYRLSGMGLNPNHGYIDSTSINSERYNMIQNYLESSEQYNSNNFFHRYPHFGAFACASQVQLDVDYDDLLVVLNTFSQLESIKGFLFSNSPMSDRGNSLACARDYLWEHSMYGYNPENTGMYTQNFKVIDDIIDDIMKRSFFNVARNSRYIYFTPLKMADFFNAQSVRGYHTINGELFATEFTPRLDDLKYFRSYKYADLTFRGTVEFRSDCQQPICDTMTVAAFHLGAISNIHRIAELLENDRVLFNKGRSPSQLRALSVAADLPKYVQVDQLRRLILNVLSLVYDGLLLRKKGEERFLLPLLLRAERLENPGKVHLRMLSEGQPIGEVVEKYSHFEHVLLG